MAAKGKMMSEKPREPSDMFMQTVCSRGSVLVECELCGRLNFGGHEGDFDEGEQEALWEKQKKAPDKYHDHADVGVGWGYIDGQQVVWGCPCNKAREIEDWIWSHRWIIATYLKLRAQSLLAQAEANLANSKGLPEVLNEAEKAERQAADWPAGTEPC